MRCLKPGICSDTPSTDWELNRLSRHQKNLLSVYAFNPNNKLNMYIDYSIDTLFRRRTYKFKGMRANSPRYRFIPILD